MVDFKSIFVTVVNQLKSVIDWHIYPTHLIYFLMDERSYFLELSSKSIHRMEARILQIKMRLMLQVELRELKRIIAFLEYWAHLVDTTEL